MKHPVRRFILLLALVFLPTLPAQVTAHYINVGQAASALLEFPSGAILIDAGGESTNDDVYKAHLIGYLHDFFTRRTDLNNTLEGIIISHPHIDHTMLLMDVMQNFTVHALVDNGATKGSGIGPLNKARKLAQKQHLHYVSVGDAAIHGGGMSISLFDPDASGAPKMTLLTGFRACDNANNDSISVRIETPETVLLFAGDSEDEDKTCSPELTVLGQRYKTTALHGVKVFHAAHHGSPNGTTAAFIGMVTPAIAVISAGDPARTSPGVFHAFQYGHPRDVAVAQLSGAVTDTRAQLGGGPEDVLVFPKVKQTTKISMTKAVYCTCWDGDIQVAYRAGETTPHVTTTGFRPAIH